MTTQTLLLDSYLKELRLPTMLRECPAVSRSAAEQNAAYELFLQTLAEREVQERQRKAMARRMREAQFPFERDLGEFNFTAVPKLNSRRLLELAKGEYLGKHESIVFLGPPGVGKTHLAIALGREACRQGRRVAFFTAAGLATAYAEARQGRELRKLERIVARHQLVIVDELGYIPLGQGAAENLFAFFSQCYERVSLIVTTNLPFSQWPQIFGDERLTAALIDRLTHRAHILDLVGESHRFRQRLEREARS